MFVKVAAEIIFKDAGWIFKNAGWIFKNAGWIFKNCLVSTSVDFRRQSENRRFFVVFLRFLIFFVGRHFSYMGGVNYTYLIFNIVLT